MESRVLSLRIFVVIVLVQCKLMNAMLTAKEYFVHVKLHQMTVLKGKMKMITVIVIVFLLVKNLNMVQ